MNYYTKLVLLLIYFSNISYLNKVMAFQQNDFGSDSADSGIIIRALYKNVELLPSKHFTHFDYKYSYDKITKIISVTCTKKVNKTNLKYIVTLKDSSGIFNDSSFSIGDDYQYITSYFLIDNLKLPLDNIHAINGGNDFLVQVSNVWNDETSSTTIKVYKVGNRKILFIKGTNSYCNGNNCSDYVVYILQELGGKASLNAVYFSGKNYPYDFNSTSLFNRSGTKNPEILVPKNDKFVTGLQDFYIYEIHFRNLKRYQK